MSAPIPKNVKNVRSLFVKQAEELLAHVGLSSSKICLVGFSMGGLIAVDYARQHADQIVGVALLSPAGLVPVKPRKLRVLSKCPAPVASSTIRLAQLLAKNKVLEEYYSKTALPEKFNPDSKNWRQISHRNCVSCLQIVKRLELWDSFSLYEEFARTNMPKFLCWGSEDKVVPWRQCKDAVTKILPDASLQVHEGAGHLLLDDMPAVVCPNVVGFLLECVARSASYQRTESVRVAVMEQRKLLENALLKQMETAPPLPPTVKRKGDRRRLKFEGINTETPSNASSETAVFKQIGSNDMNAASVTRSLLKSNTRWMETEKTDAAAAAGFQTSGIAGGLSPAREKIAHRSTFLRELEKDEEDWWELKRQREELEGVRRFLFVASSGSADTTTLASKMKNFLKRPNSSSMGGGSSANRSSRDSKRRISLELPRSFAGGQSTPDSGTKATKETAVLFENPCCSTTTEPTLLASVESSLMTSSSESSNSRSSLSNRGVQTEQIGSLFKILAGVDDDVEKDGSIVLLPVSPRRGSLLMQPTTPTPIVPPNESLEEQTARTREATLESLVARPRLIVGLPLMFPQQQQGGGGDVTNYTSTTAVATSRRMIRVVSPRQNNCTPPLQSSRPPQGEKETPTTAATFVCPSPQVVVSPHLSDGPTGWHILEVQKSTQLNAMSPERSPNKRGYSSQPMASPSRPKKRSIKGSAAPPPAHRFEFSKSESLSEDAVGSSSGISVTVETKGAFGTPLSYVVGDAHTGGCVGQSLHICGTGRSPRSCESNPPQRSKIPPDRRVLSQTVIMRQAFKGTNTKSRPSSGLRKDTQMLMRLQAEEDPRLWQQPRSPMIITAAGEGGGAYSFELQSSGRATNGGCCDQYGICDEIKMKNNIVRTQKQQICFEDPGGRHKFDPNRLHRI